MDAGGGMSQAVADLLYQSQWGYVDFPVTNGVTLNTGDQKGAPLLLTLSLIGTVASMTLGMPTNPKLGQIIDINCPQGAITTLNLTAPGMTIMNPPAGLAIGDYFSFRYTKANIWVRRI